MSPLAWPLAQPRSAKPSAGWQLSLHCHQHPHVNYHLAFYNYLMNSGAKVVPLRKTKLPQNCMTKEKQKSLPARAGMAEVLTRAATSSLRPGAGSGQSRVRVCPSPQELAPHPPPSSFPLPKGSRPR